MSPELLIRRLVYAREAYYKKSGKSQTTEFYEEMIEKNYDNPSEILQIINQHQPFCSFAITSFLDSGIYCICQNN